MPKLRILEEYETDIPDDPKGWFADWVLRYPEASSRHITQSYQVLRVLRDSRELPEQIEVNEYFGGLGCQALAVQELFAVKQHRIAENNSQAWAHLFDTIPGNPLVLLRDSYKDPLGPTANLELADFGDLTVWKMEHNKPYSDLCDHIFGGAPGAVVLTDIAGERLHLQAQRYSGLLGPFEGYEEYLQLLGQYVASRWGYSPRYTAWQRWSSVTWYSPLPGPHTVTPVLNHPRGIEVIK